MMGRPLQGTVGLPGSKSESNRALMIAAYGGFRPEVENISEANDTVLLQSLLEQVNQQTSSDVVELDCEDAGTVSRFLMTYLADTPGEWLLTGKERLRQRPMAPLIKALRQLGADLTCLEKEGCLPLRIRGKKLKGGGVSLDASQSSQFVSSLLLAAPTWEKGLQLTLTAETVSGPYIDMTVSMMERFGVRVIRNKKVITVAHQRYHPCCFTVSADWSAASYWYEMMALSSGGNLLLKGLRHDPLQGDSRVAEIFKELGVVTRFVDEGVLITLQRGASLARNRLEIDFSDTPDLFPSLIVTCVSLHIETVFNSISTLYNKESDRVNGLISELSKLYRFDYIITNDNLIIRKSLLHINKYNKSKIVLNTYNDHRLAMALMGLSVRFRQVEIQGNEVVNKSYPTFWEEVHKLDLD